MKSRLVCTLTFILTSGLGLSAFADNTQVFAPPAEASVQFSRTFIPIGFDNNDNVQIVGEGLFTDSCYRPATSKVAIDTAQKTITLTPMAYKYQGACLQVLVPWHEVINLGIIKNIGDYRVYQNGDPQKVIGTLKIAAAQRSEPDDYLYAPISQVYYKSNNGTSTVTVSGEMSNSCLMLNEVRVSLQPDVIVIQPISQMSQQSNCQAGHFPFEKSVDFKSPKAGEYLLHVRSLNGKSFNNLIQVN